VTAFNDAEADAIGRAVAACPGVARLGDQVATHLPGRRVAGVRRRAGRVEVHVVASDHTTVADIAAAVRDAVAATGATEPVDVVIEDLTLDGSDGGIVGGPHNSA
jgi:hypothetical protein